MKLFEIVGEYLELFDMLDDPETDEQVVTDTLEAVKGELEAKAEGYVAVLKEFEARAKVFEQEEKDWKAKKEAARKAAGRLKDALFEAMVATGHDGKEGLDTGKHVLKVVNNGGIQPLWTDELNNIPEEYIKVKKEADNDKIRAYLKDLPEDVSCTWARLEPRGRRLQIK